MNWFKDKTHSSFHKVVRGFFFAFCVYHVVVMIIMPNSGSILGRRVGNYFAPYANLIGMNGSWEFFSPDPPHPLYFDYKVYYENDVGVELKPSENGFFPDWKISRTLHPNHIRLKNAVRFFSMNKKAVEQSFVQWLCRKHEGANRVRIEEILMPVAQLDTYLKPTSGGLLSSFFEDSKSGLFEIPKSNLNNNSNSLFNSDSETIQNPQFNTNLTQNQEAEQGSPEQRSVATATELNRKGFGDIDIDLDPESVDVKPALVIESSCHEDQNFASGEHL